MYLNKPIFLTLFLLICSQYAHTQSFTATQNLNDAYIDLNWSFDVDPCLLDAGGNPYPGNMAIQLLAGGNQIYSQNINDLTPFLGPPQPVFDYVTYFSDSLGYYSYDFEADAAVQNANNYTLELWMRAESPDTYIFNDIFPNSSIRLVDHASIVFTEFGNEAGVLSFDTLRLNAWNHFAFVANGLGHTLIYINGENKGAINFKFPLTDFRSFGGTEGTSFAEMRIWDRIRTANEISNNKLVNTFSPTQQNLIVQLKHANDANSLMTDFAMVDGVSQIFTIDTSFATIIPYETTPLYTPLTGIFRHAVGPSQSVNYEIKLFYNFFLSEAECGIQLTTGQTLPYQIPTDISVSNDRIEKIMLKWKNNSALISSFVIKRDGELIKTINANIAVGDTFEIEDIFTFDNISSIENGAAYIYTIEAIDVINNVIYPQSAGSGSTIPINFQATDVGSGLTEKIEASWSNSIAPFADKFELRRNGSFVTFLDNDVFSYTDFLPIYGEPNAFEFILWKDGSQLVADYDEGSVPANGIVKGRVITQTGNYPVAGVTVTATAQNGNSTGSAMTNALGEFEIADLTYGLIDSFSIVASLAGHTFLQVGGQYITLTRNEAVKEGIIILDEEGYEPDNSIIDINSFMATPQVDKDQVFLDWSASSSTPNVFVEIARDGKLIFSGQGVGSLNSQVFDTKGIPGATVKYIIRIFTIENGKVNEESESVQVSFPKVSAVPALTVSPDHDLGIVNLSWSSTSTNVSGFNIYRNEKLIAYIDGPQFTFKDTSVQYNVNLTYAIGASRSVQSIDFEADPLTLGMPDPVNLGAFPIPTNVIATEQPNVPSVKIEWNQPNGIGLNYNFTGYRIYRGNTLISVVYKDRTLEIEDREGFGFSGVYGVSSFLLLDNGKIEESEIVQSLPVTYPKLPTPIAWSVGVSQNNNSFVQMFIDFVNWFPSLTNNFDGYKWYKDNVLIATTPTHTSFMYDATPNSGSYEYSVRTYRKIGQNIFLSDPLSQSVTINSNDMPLQHPINVTASRNLPNHVKICWEYPDFIPAKFVIRGVDGGNNLIFKDTLPEGTLAYYDYLADPQNPNLRYNIEAVIDGNCSKLVYAHGNVVQRRSIYGIIREASTGKGVPNADVRICWQSPDICPPLPPCYKIKIVHSQTKTDSTGFYYFDTDFEINFEDEVDMWVEASSPNSDILIDSIPFEESDDFTHLKIDFEDIYEYPRSANATSEVSHFSITPDTMSLNMLVHFDTDNDQYSLVEMSRGFTDLDDIEVADPKLVVDSLVAPGIKYGYTLRTIEERAQDRVYSPFAYAEAKVPDLESVINLTGTILPDKNSVWIQWSHRYNNAQKYIILRNDEYLTEVLSNDPFQYVDQTGLPGTAYKYTLVAVLERDGNTYSSDPKSVEVRFPRVSPPTNLVANIPFLDNVFLADSLPIDTHYTLNHVQLIWTYADTNIQSFKIYRNGDLLEIVDKSIKNYKDYTYTPSSNVNYSVSVTKMVNGNLLESDLAKVCLQQGLCVNYPELAPPSNFNIEFRDSLADILFTFDYLPKGADGFYIYRSGDEILEDTTDQHGTIIRFDHNPSEDSSFLKLDYKRSPVYWDLLYAVQAISIRDGVEYRSEIIPFSNRIFQLPFPAPTNFKATDGELTNAVRLSWDYPSEIPLITNFRISRRDPENFSNGIEFSIDNGQRSFMDTIDFVPPIGYWEYYISSYFNGFNVIYEGAEDNGHPNLGEQQPDDWSNPLPSIAWMAPNIVIDSNLMAVSELEQDRVKIYKFISEPTGAQGEQVGWNLIQTIQNSSANWQYGYSLDLNDGVLAVGSIGKTITFDFSHPSLQIWSFDGAQFVLQHSITASKFDPEEGFDVATDNRVVVLSDPEDNIFRGYEDTDNDGSWDLIGEFYYNNPLVVEPEFGWCIDIQNDTIVVGAPKNKLTINGNVEETGTVHIYAIENGVFNLVQTKKYDFDNFPQLDKTVEFGWDLKISGNTLAICAPDANKPGTGNEQRHGGVLMYERNQNGFFDLDTILFQQDDVLEEDFGYRVDLVGDLMISSRPTIHGVDPTGKVSIFMRFNGIWTEVYNQRADLESETDYDYIGVGVAISESHIGITGKDIDYRYLPLHPAKVFDVQASDDEGNDYVEITWQTNSSASPEYHIFRDGELIAINTGFPYVHIDKPENNIDTSSIPVSGKVYQYEVRPKYNYGFHNYVYAQDQVDAGYTRAKGVLSGVIYVQGTSIPVENVKVTCSAMINESYYSYEMITGADGAFLFDSLPYAINGTVYEVVPSYLDHSFALVTPFAIPPLKPSSFVENQIIFYDTEAYSIFGKVKKQDALCGLENIKVVLCKTINGNTTRTDSTFTNDGQYAFSVNPQEVGLEKLSVFVPDIQELDNGNQSDSILFEFKDEGQSFFTQFGNFATFNEVNFTDTLTYPIEVRIQNSCGSPISFNPYKVRIYTSDGCYDKQYLTNSSGILNIDLPTNDYLIVVVDVMGSPTQTDLFAKDYLSSRPSKLDILSAHEASGTGQQPTFETVYLTYHKAALFGTMFNIFDQYICDDSNQPAIIQQGATYAIPLSVSETHSSTCGVNEGFIIVRNAAAASDPVKTVYFNGNGFPDYTFTAGFPNLVAPHLYEIQFSYFSNAGDLLASTSQIVLVEGERALPGSAVIVEPDQDEEGQIKLPMFVLRDPPGDESYTRLESGSFVSKSYEFDVSGQNDYGAYSEGFAVFGAGVLYGGFWEVEARGGAATSDKSTVEFDVSTTQGYSTSNNENAVGRSADVIVGAGFASQYGLIQRVEVVECDSVSLVNKLRFGLSDISTNWTYTVGFIEELINRNINDSILIEKGLKNYYYADGTPFTQAEARNKVGAIIQSWRDILYYHDVESVPHYALCASTAFLEGIQNPLALFNVINWRSAFCGEIGNYVGDDFVMNDVQWTNSLMTKYNNTIAAIETLKQTPVGISPGNNVAFSQSKFTDPNYLVTTIYHGGLGGDTLKSVQSLTYGGPNVQDKTVTTQQSGSSTYAYTGYSAIDLKVGAMVKLEEAITIPIINKDVRIGEVEGKLGFRYSGSSSETTTRAQADGNTSTMQYVISDNDQYDNGTVIVLQGPMQNHSPYFMWVGGETSCPAEEALTVGNDVDPVSIDNPFIAVVNPNSGAVIASGEPGANHYAPPQYNIHPDSVAVFWLQIGNMTPTTLQRTVLVYLKGSNPYGAEIEFNGQNLGSLQNGFVPLTINAGATEQIALFVRKPSGVGFFDFENLEIAVADNCAADGGVNGEGVSGGIKSVFVSAHFKSPCSPVSLSSPINGFVVNREKVSEPDDRESILFTLTDYQSANPNLDGIQLQYQRLGTGIGWENIPMGYIEKTALALSDAMLASGEPRIYFFDWDITGAYDLYPDGDYAIRAVAICNSANDKVSNEVFGQISRTQLIVGETQPADGLWSMGDEISIAFTSNIDCGLISTPGFIDSNLVLYDISTNQEIDFSVICQNNKLTYQVTGGLTQYDGHTLMATSREVRNLQGNFAQNAEWTFRVSTQDVEWKDEVVEVYLYEGSFAQKKVALLNLSQGSVGGLEILQSSSSESWLSISPYDMFDVSSNDALVTLQFLGNEPIGVYDDTIALAGLTGRLPELPIRLHILAAPPQLEVNQTYGDSMLLLINWRFGTDTELSKDTLDQIQAFVANEIRGSGRISQSGPFYQAAIWVKGDALEVGTSLDFEIWNSDEASLYEGLHIPSNIKFSPNLTLGTTANPEVLIVENAPIVRKRIYVDSAQVSNPHLGLSWITAFDKLEDALAIAMAFDTIWVAEGSYYPTTGFDRNSTFDISTNVIIYGGFEFGQNSPSQRSGNAFSRISGDIGTKGSNVDNSYHVITASAGFVILDGLVIEGGNANGVGENVSGGAIINSGSVTLRNCMLHAFESTNDGSIILNSGVNAKMILQDVLLNSEGLMAWVKNQLGARMTVVGRVD